jgi:hypothetical protein
MKFMICPLEEPRLAGASELAGRAAATPTVRFDRKTPDHSAEVKAMFRKLGHERCNNGQMRRDNALLRVVGDGVSVKTKQFSEPTRRDARFAQLPPELFVFHAPDDMFGEPKWQIFK